MSIKNAGDSQTTVASDNMDIERFSEEFEDSSETIWSGFNISFFNESVDAGAYLIVVKSGPVGLTTLKWFESTAQLLLPECAACDSEERTCRIS